MTEREFLTMSRELTDTIMKGYRLCSDIQSGLNDDVRNGRIPYEEWTEKTGENEKKLVFFEEQLNLFDKRLRQMKKI